MDLSGPEANLRQAPYLTSPTTGYLSPGACMDLMQAANRMSRDSRYFCLPSCLASPLHLISMDRPLAIPGPVPVCWLRVEFIHRGPRPRQGS